MSDYISPGSKKYATMTKKAGKHTKCRRYIYKTREVQHPVKHHLFPNEAWTLLSNQSHLLVSTSIKRFESLLFYKEMLFDKSLQQVLTETCKRAESHTIILVQMHISSHLEKVVSSVPKTSRPLHGNKYSYKESHTRPIILLRFYFWNNEQSEQMNLGQNLY